MPEAREFEAVKHKEGKGADAEGRESNSKRHEDMRYR